MVEREIVGWLNGLPLLAEKLSESEKIEREIQRKIKDCHSRIHKAKRNELYKGTKRIVVAFKNGKHFLIDRKLFTNKKRGWAYRWISRDLAKHTATELLGFDEYGNNIR